MCKSKSKSKRYLPSGESTQVQLMINFLSCLVMWVLTAQLYEQISKEVIASLMI